MVARTGLNVTFVRTLPVLLKLKFRGLLCMCACLHDLHCLQPLTGQLLQNQHIQVKTAAIHNIPNAGNVLELYIFGFRRVRRLQRIYTSWAGLSFIYDYLTKLCRFRCPCGLRRTSATTWLLGSLVLIPLKTWKIVSCVCCVLCR